MSLGEQLAVILPLVGLQLVLIVIALRDLLQPDRRVKGGNRVVWAVVICLAGIVVPLAYLFFVREVA
jgi:hypothetical protein